MIVPRLAGAHHELFSPTSGIVASPNVKFFLNSPHCGSSDLKRCSTQTERDYEFDRSQDHSLNNELFRVLINIGNNYTFVQIFFELLYQQTRIELLTHGSYEFPFSRG
jgi:hypothetical protein